MKQLLSLLLISFALLSCTKNNGDDEGESDTTVNFTNNLPRSFNNVVIGSWKGGEQAKLIKTVGTMTAGSSTGDIEITDNSLIKVYFYYDDNGKTYMTPYGFGISQGTFNNWAIDGNIIFDEISKTSELYPN